jgi:hypothetical protein
MILSRMLPPLSASRSSLLASLLFPQLPGQFPGMEFVNDKSMAYQNNVRMSGRRQNGKAW